MTDARGETRHGPPRRADRVGPRRRVRHQRHDHHPPGLPPGLRRGTDDEGDDADERERLLPAADRGRRARRPPTSSRTATRPSRRPATPRPRWSSGSRSSASAARRPTPRSSRRSRTAATSGRRASALVPDASPRSPSSRCSSSTSPTSSTTPSPPAWRTTSTTSPAASRGRRALAHRFYFGPTRTGDADGARRAASASRRWCGPGSTSIDAAAINSIPIGVDPDGVPIVAKPGTLRPVPQAGRGHRVDPRRHRPRRAHRREGARAARGAQGRPATSATIPATGLHDLRQGRPLRALRAARRARRRRRAPSPRRRRCSRP